jgi:hypothetical protein
MGEELNNMDLPGDRTRRMARLVLAAGVLALFGSGVGCVGFRGEELGEKRPWPPDRGATGKKPTVALSLVGKAAWNGKPTPINPAMADHWIRFARETYESSALFSEVRTGDVHSDLQAQMEVLDAATGSKFFFFMTGFTLGILPSWGSDEFTWKTTFKDGAGNVRGAIEKKESITTFMELLMVFGMPFSTPSSALTSALGDLNRSTLQDALEKGYLNP